MELQSIEHIKAKKLNFIQTSQSSDEFITTNTEYFKYKIVKDRGRESKEMFKIYFDGMFLISVGGEISDAKDFCQKHLNKILYDILGIPK